MEESREDVALLQFYGVFGGWAVAFFFVLRVSSVAACTSGPEKVAATLGI